MKKIMKSFVLVVFALLSLLVFSPQTAQAAGSTSALRIEPSETNGIPAIINAFDSESRTLFRTTHVYQFYLPGNVNAANCFLTWDSEAVATVDGVSYVSGECPIPPVGVQKTYTFTIGNRSYGSYQIVTYQGSPSVQAVFIDVDETGGKATIEQMDSDSDHQVTCSGRINIGGTWYEMTKMKGRGNSTWRSSDDKKPYNITLDKKINFPGIDSEKTKKWSFLAEIFDHSLLTNRTGFYLAHELGVGQDTVSADVWMNGEYQGCYTVTPKTDSYVTKDGFMIENDNYTEAAIEEGGDPQFKLVGQTDNSSADGPMITVKKIGDNLLKATGYEDPESADSLRAATADIQAWLQDAWEAMYSPTGYNSKGKYYTDYIDIESFAKMYLVHEYVKSNDFVAGSLLFYRNGTSDSDKLYAGPVWDLDLALGSTTQNRLLGEADDRENGDRRSGQGAFISLVTEYRASVYKTLSRHDDFMEVVYRQYNLNRSAFENLPYVLDQMITEIQASAMMNHIKVNELRGNNHKYSRSTTIGSGVYRQTYLATTDSKTDWANYAANLRTYVATRSLWFKNTYTISVQDGWLKAGGKWYFIENYGPKANGFVEYGGKYYYIKSFTPLENGWLNEGGAYYYIKNYTALEEGWVFYRNYYYYIRSYRPVVNDWVSYNGTNYHFNEAGVCDRAA